jgi:hypothetical protein
MLTILVIAGASIAVRGAFAALRSWRDLPRSNEDMVYF